MLAYLEKNRLFSLILAALSLALIAWFDHLTGFEISFSVFYLFPVSIVAWTMGRSAGLAASLAAAVLWLVMDQTSGHVYSEPNIVYWNATARLVFFVVTSLSLSYIRAASKKEKELSRLKSEMVSLVSHEVNNALLSISLASMLLQEEEGEGMSDTKKKFYAIIDQTHRRLSQLAKTFLAKARLESGKFIPERKRVELRALAWETVSTLALMAGEKNVAVDTDFPPVVIPANSDPEIVSLVINNLTLNALKYTPSGGKVRLKLEGRGDLVRMSVVDTGIGIKPGELDAIFSGFHRTEEGREMSKGTGIGLNASQEMLHALGSELKVETEAGKGSTFYFELPVWKDS